MHCRKLGTAACLAWAAGSGWAQVPGRDAELIRAQTDDAAAVRRLLAQGAGASAQDAQGRITAMWRRCVNFSRRGSTSTT